MIKLLSKNFKVIFILKTREPEKMKLKNKNKIQSEERMLYSKARYECQFDQLENLTGHFNIFVLLIRN